MKLEDIKKEMPKTPEMIHNRIQDEIRKQMENEQIAVFPTQNAKKTKWSRTRVAAVTAVCILGVSTRTPSKATGSNSRARSRNSGASSPTTIWT